MQQEKKQIADILIGIRCLELLFYNYTQEDFKFLLNIDAFNHTFYKYGNKKTETLESFKAWEIFNNIGYEAQEEVLTYACNRYGKECAEGFKEYHDMKALMQLHIQKQKQ